MKPLFLQMVPDKEYFRFLVVGLGSIGKRHVRNLRELFPESIIIVLRHGDGCQDNQTWLAEGADSCVKTLNEALIKQPLAAIIAGPAPYHLTIASVLAAKGIHLLIEKPLSHSSKDVTEFISLCKEKGVRLLVGYNLRFTPALQKFRSMIAEGYVGQVLSVKAEVGQYLPGWRPEIDYRTSVSAQKRLGGGVLLELSHEIDYLIWLFGAVDSVRGVVCRQGTLDIEVEDMAHVILVFKQNKAEQKVVASLSMDFLRHDTTRCCTVVGAGGTLRWDGIEGRVERYVPKNKEWECVFWEQIDSNDSYKQEIICFIKMIEQQKEPYSYSSAWDAKNVVDIVEAIHLSSEQGKTITLSNEEMA